MEYSGKDASCEVEIDIIVPPKQDKQEQNTSFLLQHLKQKSVVEEKKALVHFRRVKEQQAVLACPR